MAEISEYLGSVALVESFGKPITVVDVASTVAHQAMVVGSWTTRRLEKENQFFVSCPSYEVVQSLVALGHIRREGFSLNVNH